MKLQMPRQVFEKHSNIKLHENSLSGSQVFHADRRSEGRIGVTKLIVAFCSRRINIMVKEMCSDVNWIVRGKGMEITSLKMLLS